MPAVRSSAMSAKAEAFAPLKSLDTARQSAHPADRLKGVRAEARRLRERLLAGSTVEYYTTIDLVRVPYPVRYGLLNAARVTTPFMHILNRLFIVQFHNRGRLRTLLFSPSDLDGNKETPFFKRLGQSFGPLQPIGERLIAPILSTVEEALALRGLRPEQIDYISYDHLHTQDLRKWLGVDGQPGFFPNAKLLVMRQEWQSAQALLPPQQDWYCPQGIAGIDPRRVVLLDSSVLLGDGVALVHSPGHTEGNHSLVVHTPEGVLVSSENGVSADSYAPLASRIPGVACYARDTGMEVILNGNTLEGGLDQYISMVMEKELAGPSLRNPAFAGVVPSSELSAYWLFPGLKPSFSFGPLEFGRLHGASATAQARAIPAAAK